MLLQVTRSAPCVVCNQIMLKTNDKYTYACQQQSIPFTCDKNWKFVAFVVPEIIGGTEKTSAVPGYADASFSPSFSWACGRMDPVNIPAKFEVPSFSRS